MILMAQKMNHDQTLLKTRQATRVRLESFDSSNWSQISASHAGGGYGLRKSEQIKLYTIMIGHDRIWMGCVKG